MSDSSGWGPSGPYGGAPGGWGWMPPPPPPPRPGVIPLAPLGVDHILGGAFVTLRRYAKPLLGLSALVGLVLAGATLGMEVLVRHVTAARLDRIISGAPRSVDWTDVRTVLVASGAVLVATSLLTLVASAFVQASSAATLHDAVLGRRAGLGAVWKRARPRVPSVLGVMLLLALIAAVPTSLFLLMSFALVATAASVEPLMSFGTSFLLWLLAVPLTTWPLVLFSFAPAAAVLEGASPVTAIRRSARLVRGAWWRTFGITLLGGLVAFMVSVVVNLPLTLATPTPQPYGPTGQQQVHEVGFYVQFLPSMGSHLVLSAITSVLVQMFCLAFMPLVSNLLYMDQRIRREGLADVLARASAQPAPGSVE
ncbi:hypothetical protein WJM95_07030 [Streptomyces sp. f51]|uniref:DUF7847 domain-containing protein n=1 Tax=Streptomyces sp. f51 TaxID=1827742 RepID=UPI0030D4AE29